MKLAVILLPFCQFEFILQALSDFSWQQVIISLPYEVWIP